MKYQKGFISIVLLIVVLGALAGGYIWHAKKQKAAPTHEDTTLALPVETNVEQQTQTSTTTSVTSLDTCSSDWKCFIAAATECKPVSGTLSFKNIASPFGDSLLVSGTTKYTIQKGGTASSCTIQSTPQKLNAVLSASAKAELLQQGVSDMEIQTEVQNMNAAMQYTIGKVTTCSGSGAALSAFISDTQKGNATNIKASGTLEGAQSTITTSNNLKVTCKTS